MKVIALLSLLSVVTATVDVNLSAESQMGQNLISKARRLDEAEDEEEANNWVSSYSVKFQGCHSIKQWNDEADEEEDVRISTKSLIRFRLCPAESCSATKAAGCTAGFGDYVIDMPTFMENYFEAVRQNTEAACAVYLANQCNCEDGDDQDDGFDEEYCEYDCFNDAGMPECIDRNPYNDDEEEREFEVEEYLECKELEIENNDRRKRKLDEEEEEVQYFVGPYCGNQGGSVNLGLFTDDTCTTFAEDVRFEDLTGYDLPYEEKSIVDANCVSCLEPVEEDDNDDQDAEEDADAVSESCEALYKGAGKCEAKLPEGMVAYPNENACNYMEGIRIVRQDGIIDTGSSRPSAVATGFIVLSAMAFSATAFYVWYLRTRLGVKKNTLL